MIDVGEFFVVAEADGRASEAIYAFDRCEERLRELGDEKLIGLWVSYHHALCSMLESQN